MPLDASDRIRKIQEIALFQGYAVQQNTLQPDVNVSTCATFYGSTIIHKYTDYQYKAQIEGGRKYFSTCQG
jgi:hypothetical protein